VRETVGVTMMGNELRETVDFGGTDARNSEEIVSFHRRNELPGVELRSLKNSDRAFRCYSTDFEFFAPSTWHGELWHRRQKVILSPGSVLCAHPEEVYLVRRVLTPGAGDFLTIDSQVLQEYLEDHQRSASNLHFRAVARPSALLAERLAEVVRVVRPGPSALAIQSAMVEFVNLMVTELVEDCSGGSVSSEAGMRTAESVRECLHYDPTASVDLSTLAKQAGVSRYQALRTFKRRYGLPPHTYQLIVRLALAKKALRDGHQPVHVAAQYGFVDQSHFTRHFKRLLGVTPAQYARAGARGRTLRVQAFPEPFMNGKTNARPTQDGGHVTLA
jgi:AraC-like DNA-binding protein